LYHVVSEHVEHRAFIGSRLSHEFADGHVVCRNHLHYLIMYLVRIDKVHLSRGDLLI